MWVCIKCAAEGCAASSTREQSAPIRTTPSAVALSRTRGAADFGIAARPIDVEVDPVPGRGNHTKRLPPSVFRVCRFGKFSAVAFADV